MRDQILNSMTKYLEGQVSFHRTNIEVLLEGLSDNSNEIMDDFDKHLTKLVDCQSKLENLALFTEH